MICFALLGAGRLCNKTSTDRPSDCSRDRKSTRLNSSHGYISYAVFCLKKKKKTNATAADAVSEHHPRHRIEPPRAHVHRDETVRPVRCLNSPSPLTLSPRPLPAHTLRA